MYWDDLERAKSINFQTIADCEDAANSVAFAEYTYEVMVGAMTATEHAKGTPATLIGKIVAGSPRVAAAKREMAIAKGVLKTAEKRYQSTYLDYKNASAQFEREWRQVRDE